MKRESVASRTRRQVAERIVQAVLEALARGEAPPWRRPWVGGFGRHTSGRRGGKPYRRWNAWSTWVIASLCGYRSVRWYTAEFVERQGWSLRPRAPGAPIVVPLGGRRSDDLDGPPTVADWGGRVVYNHEACVGAPPEPPPPPWDATDGVDRVVCLLEEAGIDLVNRGGAHFDPANDVVSLPHPRTFDSPVAWAATALHEVVHWTGGVARLARIRWPWTRTQYAEEELVAELGAAMLCSEFGVAATRIDDEQHVAYLAAWSERLRERPEVMEEALVRADAAVALLEELAPRAFSGERVRRVAGVRDVPRTLRGGAVWRGDVRALVRPTAPSGLGADPAVSYQLQACSSGVARGVQGGPLPVLWVTGAPGDGAETLVACMYDFAARAEGLAPERVPRGRPEDCLPAVALVRSARFRTPTLLPRTGPEALERLRDHPDDRRAPMVVAARPPLATAGLPWALRVPLEKMPLPAGVARARLAKEDRRPWIAVRHRLGAEARVLEDWSGRLRAEWLDGRRGRGPLRRFRYEDSAPFAPVVLHMAQAVLDAFARVGRSAPTLGLLVDRALGPRHVGPGRPRPAGRAAGAGHRRPAARPRGAGPRRGGAARAVLRARSRHDERGGGPARGRGHAGRADGAHRTGVPRRAGARVVPPRVDDARRAPIGWTPPVHIGRVVSSGHGRSDGAASAGGGGVGRRHRWALTVRAPDRWTGAMFLEAADDFEGLTPDRSTWSEEALQGNPPRLVRYRRLRALERAFDVRPGFEALLDGSFLDHRPPHPELAEARWVYERLKDYLCAAWRVLDFNGGMLEASGEFCRAVELTEAVNDRFRGALAPIEAVVDAIVSPDGRAASLDELRSQGWPEDDLWEVDADWM